MKFLVQGDDYGFTKAVTLGIDDAITRGILRNTGMFTNMPAATLAAELMKKHPEACYGIDFNIVAGKPLTDPAKIPHLVDEIGNFHKSSFYVRKPEFWTVEGRAELMPVEEVRMELEAQYAKFIELTGHKPGYLHPHSVFAETYLNTIAELAEKYELPYSMNYIKKIGGTEIQAIVSNPNSNNKSFDPDFQLNKNTTEIVLAQKDKILGAEVAAMICHPGFMDADLLNLTSLSIERVKDHQMMTSEAMLNLVKENNIELVTYTDLVKEYGL